MNGEEKHRQNIQIYLQNGGSQKIADRHKTATLQNRAQIAYLVKDLPKQEFVQNIAQTTLPEKQTAPPEEQTAQPSKPKGLGIIAQYPTDLHPVYQEAVQLWISACSLKMKLNRVPASDQEAARQIQEDIFKIIEKFDRAKKSLDYYNEHKRVLPTETKTDFSQLSPAELILLRNNLRSNISHRDKTLKKRIAELPPEDDKSFRTKKNFILNKTEEMNELKLQLEEIENLIKK